jgi:hydrogenase nickel incorporation protein HypB
MSIPVVRQAPRNPRAASENRRTLDAAGAICLNLLGATGSGKTALLEAILPRLRAELNVGVIIGDLVGTCDAKRIGVLGVPVVQVMTDDECHLRADQVQRALGELPLNRLHLVIVENVGCLVCQGQTDLGEHLRATTLCCAGGHRVAQKYPQLFRDAALILLTKHDLLPQVDFDLDSALRTLGTTSPAAEIICTDTRKRVGIDRLAGWILGYARAQRVRQARRAAVTDAVWASS